MAVAVVFPVVASGQVWDSTTRYSLPLVTSDELDRTRSDQLFSGVAPGNSLLLRSASSLVPSLD
ncbi:MAG TPA: hypothetical protein VFX40_04425, partial [Gemmatimonadaceae bacterium]|nr:hypothetical protein [Gemmatimonadaceae bacterium]